MDHSSAKANPASSSLLRLAFLSVVAGWLTGLLVVLFRLTLGQADSRRHDFIVWAHQAHALGAVLVIAAAAAGTALAAWLVCRFAPTAAGSGIPRVEAVIRDGAPPDSLLLVPVKFIGGLLAIGSGLALGREGPSVQMGASISRSIGAAFRCSAEDRNALLAAGAGAGLATAFNAPIAGAIFVLEELVRRFDHRIAIAALGASASAIAVARVFLGQLPDFKVAALAYPSFGTFPVHMLLGVIAGLAGVAYSRAIVGGLRVAERLGHWPVPVRAALIGAVVGLTAWFSPVLVGGGDQLTQNALSGTGALLALVIAFILRFGLGALSYAAGTPGGLFAPMLVLGAQLGLIFGHQGLHWFPSLLPDPAALAVVGMAAFFAAVVRAPLTGMVLAIELTGSFTLLLPGLSACFTAMVVATLLRSPPIYDSLAWRAVD